MGRRSVLAWEDAALTKGKLSKLNYGCHEIPLKVPVRVWRG